MEKVVAKGQFEGSRKHFRYREEKEESILKFVKKMIKRSRCKKIEKRKD
jgi:hypothetical protein